MTLIAEIASVMALGLLGVPLYPAKILPEPPGSIQA